VRTQTKTKTNEAQAAEFPTFEELKAGPNYSKQGLIVTDPDPDMVYYFAAADDDPNNPQGVGALEREGYRRSTKDHNSLDCILVEQPRELWKQRKAHEHRQNQALVDGVKRPKGIPSGDQRKWDRGGRMR